MLFHSGLKASIYSFIFSLVWVFALFTPILAATEGNPQKKMIDIQRLIVDLENNDEFVRMKAAKSLGEMGAAAQPAIAALSEISKNDPDEDVRRFALKALEKIGKAQPTPDPKIKELLAKLEDTDEFVRMKAAKTLGEMGPEAQAATAALTEISQKDPDEDVRRFALDALKKIKPAAVDAKPLPEEPKVTPENITITRTITLFSEAYQDVSGLIKSPSSRLFFVQLKNNSSVPVHVNLLRVRWFDNDKEIDMAEVEGPEDAILPDCEVSHRFSFPQSKATIQWKIEVIAVKSVELAEEDRQLLKENSRLLKNMRVLKPRVIEKFGVVVGDKFTVYNPSSKLASGVRVMLLGYDKNDRLVSIQFYYCEDVPQGFNDVINDATIDPDKKKKSIVKFENFADAGKDAQAARLKGEVVAFGVRKMVE